MACSVRNERHPSRAGEGCKWEAQLEALFAKNLARLAHLRDAAALAMDVAQLLGLGVEDRERLRRAALAHDLGYAPALYQTGYHPLDGALFLASCGEDPLVVEAVLRHSRAGQGEHLPEAIRKAYAVRPPVPEAAWLVDAVTFCDWRAAGVGGRVSLGERLQDILLRHPYDTAKAERARRLVAEVRRSFAQLLHAHGLPWIVADIDNTLLAPGGELPQQVHQALQRYQDAGGCLTLASGKHPRSVLAHAHDWGLSGWQVAANGTCAVGPDARVEVLASLGAGAEALVEALSGLGLGVAVYRVDGIEPRGAWQEAYSAAFARYGELRPAGERLPGPILKILVVLHEEEAEREAKVRALAQEAKCTACRSDRQFMELLPQGCGKGTAARWILDQANWPVLATIAVGDNENDAHLFALCGLSAVVANAPAAVQATADLLLPSCHQAGVAELLKALVDGGVLAAMERFSATP